MGQGVDQEGCLPKTVWPPTLFAMFGVALSSVIIFLVLTIMNKMTFMQNLKAAKNEDDESLIKDEIVIPSGENDALKIFFEKTR